MNTTHKIGLDLITILKVEGPFSWHRFENTTYTTFRHADDVLRTMASEMTPPSEIHKISFKVIWMNENEYAGTIELRASHRNADEIVGEHMRSFATASIEMDAPWMSNEKKAKMNEEFRALLDHYHLTDVVEDEPSAEPKIEVAVAVSPNAPMTYVRQYTLMQRNGIEQEGDEDVEGILLVGTVLASWTTDHCDYGYDTVFVRPAYHDGEQAWLLTYSWNPGHGYTASGDQEVIVDLIPGLQFLVEQEQFQALFGAGVPS